LTFPAPYLALRTVFGLKISNAYLCICLHDYALLFGFNFKKILLQQFYLLRFKKFRHNYAHMMHNYVSDNLSSGTTSKSSTSAALRGFTRIPVAVIGARGYSGLELVRLLLNHPSAELIACYGHEKSFQLSDVLSSSPNPSKPLPQVLPLDQLPMTTARVVFLATPAEASIELACGLLGRGIDVIDLSGAFRLQKGTPVEQAQTYLKWYGFSHPQPDLLSQASYGLVPFSEPSRSKPALISNPGCYATSVLMALIPLLRKGLILEDSIVIDAKSGSTGAGKKAAENLLHSEVDEGCLPYKVGKHQHSPEIGQFLNTYAGVQIDPIFTTHLLPTRRGIISSIYARVAPGVDALQIHAAYSEAFEQYPLAHWGEIDGDGTSGPVAKPWMLSLKRVSGSPRTQISYQVLDGQLYLFSLIDNLLKGAASQAIENFNRMQDLPVAMGLESMEGNL
jgi:N-acetyl-gamma-glutamyl-phosphate reductase